MSREWRLIYQNSVQEDGRAATRWNALTRRDVGEALPSLKMKVPALEVEGKRARYLDFGAFFLVLRQFFALCDTHVICDRDILVRYSGFEPQTAEKIADLRGVLDNLSGLTL
jgi:hypothetical protein